MQKTPLNPSEAALLDAMMADMDSQQAVYRPGAYWAPKVRVAAQAVRDNGYSNFRSARSVVGLSYADNPQTHYALVTYDGNDDKSLAPDKLADFFPYGSFSIFTKAKLFEPWRHNFYAVGKNKGAQENHDRQNQVAAGR